MARLSRAAARQEGPLLRRQGRRRQDHQRVGDGAGGQPRRQAACCWCRPIRRTTPPTSSAARSGPRSSRCCRQPARARDRRGAGIRALRGGSEGAHQGALRPRDPEGGQPADRPGGEHAGGRGGGALRSHRLADPRRGRPLRPARVRHGADRPHPAADPDAGADGGVDSRAVAVAAGDARRRSGRQERSDHACRWPIGSNGCASSAPGWSARASPRSSWCSIAERLPIEETAAGDGAARRGRRPRRRARSSTACCRRSSPDPFLVARQTQERVYLDEIDRRFAVVPRLRVPQLPRDVHGIETLQTIAGGAVPRRNAARPGRRTIDDQPGRHADEFASYLRRLHRQGAGEPVRSRRSRRSAPPSRRSRHARRRTRAPTATPRASGASRKCSATWPTPSACSAIGCSASRAPTRRRWPASTRTSGPRSRLTIARPIADVVKELLAVREATLALIESLDEAALGPPTRGQRQADAARGRCAGSWRATPSTTSASCTSATASVA